MADEREGSLKKCAFCALCKEVNALRYSMVVDFGAKLRTNAASQGRLVFLHQENTINPSYSPTVYTDF